jgi:hypothetical protein
MLRYGYAEDSPISMGHVEYYRQEIIVPELVMIVRGYNCSNGEQCEPSQQIKGAYRG